MKKLILFLAMITALSSCKKETPISSIITLKSTAENFRLQGFSFAERKIIESTASRTPDFSVMNQRNEGSEIMGVFLTHPNLEKRFYLAKSFNKMDSASTFFKSLVLSKDTLFQNIALPVKPFQVWIIKTNDAKFGKILIHETIAKEINTTPYAEVKFEWSRM